MASRRARNLPLVYFEFGTGSGNTLQRAIASLRDHPGSSIVLFDSFEGLPEPAHDADKHVLWEKGEFAFTQDYIRTIVRKAGFAVERVRFVPGFFEKSLTSELREDLAKTPPAFVTIDVDFYTSTVEVLTWIAPLLSSGTLIYFDDLHAFDCRPDYGQLRALNEFNAHNSEGQLVPHPILGNRIYVYYRKNYEIQ
jgi:hypothetical protein